MFSFSGWKTTLLTSVFFLLTSVFFASWYYADDFCRCLIRMLPDVRWVGFLPPFYKRVNKLEFLSLLAPKEWSLSCGQSKQHLSDEVLYFIGSGLISKYGTRPEGLARTNTLPCWLSMSHRKADGMTDRQKSVACNIVIINVTARIVRMMIISDAPSCGNTYVPHSDNSRCVIYI